MSEIIDMRNNGATYQEIADAVGLSKQRVRTIIIKHSPELKGTRGSALRRANDQVNRLQAEIERLKTQNNELKTGLKVIKRTEIKKFAERLKEKVNLDLCEAINCSDYLYDLPKLIDNLVKEMTEQSVNYGSSKTEGSK